MINVEQISCSLAIRQVQDRVPHSAAPHTDSAESERGSSRSGIGSRGTVASERLAITLDTSSCYSSKISWSDTKSRQLESRLPNVLTTFENWAVIDADRTEADPLAEIEAQKRREREDELAREAYTHQVLADQLNTDLQAWEFVGRLRNYLGAMAARIEQMVNDDEPITTPGVKPPGYSDIAQFRKRLGFGAGYW